MISTTELSETEKIIPVEEFIKSLIALDVRIEQLVKLDTVCFNKRWDGLDGVRRVVDFPLLERHSDGKHLSRVSVPVSTNPESESL